MKGVESEVSTKDLKRNLSRKNLTFLCLGQIFGAGILSMLGIAIGMTGRSIFISLIIASIFMCISLIPTIFVGGTVRLRGGEYSRAFLLGGEKWAGMYIIVFIVMNMSISMYAISFSDYLLSLIPNLPHKVVSIAIVTIIFFLHYFGTKNAARVQTIIITLLVSAFTLFTVFGFFKIRPGYFSEPGFMTGGISSLIGAGAYITFATGGANLLVNYSGEAKNPTKDIPIIMVLSTVGVSILYALMSVVASGVLPLDKVSNQPLTYVAREVLPAPLYVFFIVGGALIGLTGTMNSQIGGSTTPIMQACVDGWFPQRLATLHPKYKTPIYILGIYYLIGILPIIFNLDISLISNSVLILYNAINMILALFTMRLPRVAHDYWENSSFKISGKMLTILSFVSAFVILVQIFLLLRNLSVVASIANISILIAAFLFGFLRANKVTMENSIEES